MKVRGCVKTCVTTSVYKCVCVCECVCEYECECACEYECECACEYECECEVLGGQNTASQDTRQMDTPLYTLPTISRWWTSNGITRNQDMWAMEAQQALPKLI